MGEEGPGCQYLLLQTPHFLPLGSASYRSLPEAEKLVTKPLGLFHILSTKGWLVLPAGQSGSHALGK